MTRRRLTPEEIDLWRKVVDQTERLHPRAQTAPPAPLPKPTPAKPAPRRVDGFRVGQAANGRAQPHDLMAQLSDRLAQQPVSMDQKAFRRMKRGKLSPEGRIDLHGMTLDRAHPALTRFILTAQASGKRLVLVITGKGRDRADDGPMPVRRGILKHQVPQWLSMPPLSQAVIQISAAHVSHGGEGAYYVYLKRSR